MQPSPLNKTDLFIDNKREPKIYALNYLDNKIINIGRADYEPLFDNLNYEELHLPTRRQIHSKKYHIHKNYTHLATIENVNIENLKLQIKKFILKGNPYAYNSIKQDKYNL